MSNQTETYTRWADLCPEGRVIFYEGDDPDGFRREIIAEFGFDPAGSWPDSMDDMIPPWHTDACNCRYDGHWTAEDARAKHWTENYSFWCPPGHLDAIYSSGRFPMGS